MACVYFKHCLSDVVFRRILYVVYSLYSWMIQYSYECAIVSQTIGKEWIWVFMQLYDANQVFTKALCWAYLQAQMADDVLYKYVECIWYTMHIFISFSFHFRWCIRMLLSIEMQWVCVCSQERKRKHVWTWFCHIQWSPHRRALSSVCKSLQRTAEVTVISDPQRL